MVVTNSSHILLLKVFSDFSQSLWIWIRVLIVPLSIKVASDTYGRSRSDRGSTFGGPNKNDSSILDIQHDFGAGSLTGKLVTLVQGPDVTLAMHFDTVPSDTV